MARVTDTFVLVVFLCLSAGSCQAAIANTAMLVQVLDDNNDGVISQPELNSLFVSLAGNDDKMTRCKFVQELTSAFHGSPCDVSALFDVLQVEEADTLTEAELKAAILGDKDTKNVSSVRDTVADLETRVADALSKPFQQTNGPITMKYTDFKVTNWANDADTNNDGIVSRSEISTALRALDSNGDYGIQRCELVENLSARYAQHPLTSNQMYDILFQSRDITWAPVDSDFLSDAMDEDKNGDASKAEFIAYFTEQNKRASGVIIQHEDLTGRPRAGDGATSLTLRVSLLGTSLLLYCLLTRP
ncbi:uncharacterized protein LOC101846958 [Aplysia californica]|uniref:Uncharacterized protein LOC101846958 n=1 Tax=Aplysia californica TaxID=6500 RepID=A0ABM0ZYR1_APLCA|nr:uncharacterized protein LOC101846958 [Aplysia californica]